MSRPQVLSEEQRKIKHRDLSREYRLKHPDRVKAAVAKWQAKHKEELLQYGRDWYARNKDRKHATDASRYSRKRVEILAANSKWHKENGHRRSEYNAKRRAENPGKEKAANKIWRGNNKERLILNGHEYRARKLACGGKLSLGLSEKLMTLQRGCCAVCGRKLHGSFHRDHIKPLAGGGMNVDKNIQLLCPHCNSSKRHKDPISFMRSRGFLI